MPEILDDLKEAAAKVPWWGWLLGVGAIILLFWLFGRSGGGGEYLPAPSPDDGQDRSSSPPPAAAPDLSGLDESLASFGNILRSSMEGWQADQRNTYQLLLQMQSQVAQTNSTLQTFTQLPAPTVQQTVPTPTSSPSGSIVAGGSSGSTTVTSDPLGVFGISGSDLVRQAIESDMITARQVQRNAREAGLAEPDYLKEYLASETMTLWNDQTGYQTYQVQTDKSNEFETTIKAAKADYKAAEQAGDQAAMDAAHQKAQQARKEADQAGVELADWANDGSNYTPASSSSSSSSSSSTSSSSKSVADYYKDPAWWSGGAVGSGTYTGPI